MENTVKRFILSTTAAAAMLFAGSANAQFSSNPFQIGASGGVAFPLSDLGDGTNTGFNVAVAVGYKPLYLPIGIRAEAAYNQFNFEGGGGNINIPAFTGNLTYELPTMGFRPYAIGGVGLYRTTVDIDGAGSDSENHFGFNIGGGFKIPLTTSFETFVEARYNHVSMDGGTFAFVPVTVGIMF
ncbi:MAG: outer membrane beta-barrel protein [Gemmatimonadaceae bacterium]